LHVGSESYLAAAIGRTVGRLRVRTSVAANVDSGAMNSTTVAINEYFDFIARFRFASAMTMTIEGGVKLCSLLLLPQIASEV
jgi:hypothetical protein